MNVYFDTSVLVKLYYPEPESRTVAAWVERVRPQLIWTPLHYAEMNNAIALKVFRGEITQETLAAWRDTIEQDIAGGILKPVHPDWNRVFRRTRELSVRYTPAIGTRTLDVLHVAAAIVLERDEMITNDNRQRELAVAAGLKALSIAELETR